MFEKIKKFFKKDSKRSEEHSVVKLNAFQDPFNIGHFIKGDIVHFYLPDAANSKEECRLEIGVIKDVYLDAKIYRIAMNYGEECAVSFNNVHETENREMNNQIFACICGSTRYVKEMQEINKRATMDGMIVLAPGVFGHAGDLLDPDDKIELDYLHRYKIAISDVVYVATEWQDDKCYIGESTYNEIRYALSMHKDVYVVKSGAHVNIKTMNALDMIKGDFKPREAYKRRHHKNYKRNKK